MARPTVAILNSNDEIMILLREALEEEGFSVATGHVFDFRTGDADLLDFIRQYDPAVVIVDIAPPYEHNWRFFETLSALPSARGREFVVTTTNARALASFGGSAAVEILGKPYDLRQIVAAVKSALARKAA